MTNSTQPSIAVLADVIGSRSHADRSSLQRSIEEVLERSHQLVTPIEPFNATVGDEFQAVYPTIACAIAATSYIQLALPPDAELRFGLGQGRTSTVISSTSSDIQDGPGWWRARQAIEEVERLQSNRPHARTWFITENPDAESLANAYLLLRDFVIGTMSVSAKRYAQKSMEGLTQKDIAQEAGVSPSAVSQALRKSGANMVIEGLQALGHADTERHPWLS